MPRRSTRPNAAIEMAPARSSASASDDGRDLLHARIAFFAGTIFWLFGMVLVAAQVLFIAYPEHAPPRARVGNVIAIVGIGSLGVVWLLARYVAPTLRWLKALDAAILVGAGLMIGGAARVTAVASEHIFIPFITAILIVFARVLIVPSSPTRTFWLSFAALGLVTAGNLTATAEQAGVTALPFPAFAAGGIVLALTAVAISTVGSSVLYGLRRQVREAERLGQYTLVRKIGEGGMGAVYEARHAMLRRPTAIKLLPLSKAGAEAIARFEREVQLTSQLTHPNTVAIFDYGRSADGVFYYAMEYLAGVDLERLVAHEGPLPAARAVHLVRQVCGALDEAHQLGLVHRDIKPANVIVCRRGGAADVVKVVDFGLVKELASDDGSTAENAVPGTPAYMPPEAVVDPESLGPASDLYAVGALLYFLLSGQTVFTGRTVAEVLGHHVHTPPEPPSKRGDRPIPPDLEALVLRCLAKSPSDRPPSAASLADALAALELGETWTARDADDWWDEHDEQRRADADDQKSLGEAPTIAVTIDLGAR